MAFCIKCGNAIGDDARFCAVCGQPADQPAKSPSVSEAADSPVKVTPPPAAQVSPPPPSAPPGPGTPHATWAPPHARRPLTWLWIALAALAVVVAVVCVLVFVVFVDAGVAEGTPEETVDRLFTAMEDGDVDAIFELMDQQALTDLVGDEYLDEAKEVMGEEMFGDGAIKFRDIEMNVEETGETTATVTVTGGSVTMTGEDGEEETEDVAEADEPVEFYLVKRDGSWYLDPMSLGW